MCLPFGIFTSSKAYSNFADGFRTKILQGEEISSTRENDGMAASS